MFDLSNDEIIFTVFLPDLGAQLSAAYAVQFTLGLPSEAVQLMTKSVLIRLKTFGFPIYILFPFACTNFECNRVKTENLFHRLFAWHTERKGNLFVYFCKLDKQHHTCLKTASVNCTLAVRTLFGLESYNHKLIYVERDLSKSPIQFLCSKQIRLQQGVEGVQPCFKAPTTGILQLLYSNFLFLRLSH